MHLPKPDTDVAPSDRDPARDEELRLLVYGGLAETGVAPDVEELTRITGFDETTVREGLGRLALARHVVLDGDHRVLMAHPFATIPLGFSVMGTSTLWWGGCAWDSLAIPHLVEAEPEVLVATRCPGCGRPHAFVATRESAPAGDQIAHFLVPVAHMWDDVVHTCGHQRIFCDHGCLRAWLQRTGREQGYVMDMETLWRLASGWYEGRLDRGYLRRDPATAADYFRSVGLVGEFWGV